MPSRKAFENNLNSLVKKANWNQKEVGERIGLSQVQARKYLKGLSSPPFEVLDRLAAVFGIKVSDLFEEQSVPEPNIIIIKPTPKDALAILNEAIDELYVLRKDSPHPKLMKAQDPKE